MLIDAYRSDYAAGAYMFAISHCGALAVVSSIFC
jgi:hypothetical protein